MTLVALALLFTRVVIASVFAVAVVAKAVRFHAFAESLTDFAVPIPQRNMVAGVVLLAEAGASVALIGPLPVIGFAVADGLLVTFSIAIYRRLRMGAPTACYCFGGDRSQVDASGVWRNMSLFGLASAGLVLCFAPQAFGGRIELAQSVTTVLLAVVVAVGMIRLPSITRAVAAGAIKL
jgi:hypothetical protein